MSDALATYLHDHLAGANFAIELLGTLQEQHTGDELGEFAAALRIEVKQDRQVLERIISRAGGDASALKEATAWVGEKVSRLKLSRASSGETGTFEILETLALGILGKRALWRALSVIAPYDSRVPSEEFEVLIARAQAQHDQVEERRLQVARVALAASAK